MTAEARQPLLRPRDSPPLRSRNLLRVTLESLPAPVIVLDGRARIRYANRAARQFAGQALTVREAYHLAFADYVAAIEPGHPAGELHKVAAALEGSGAQMEDVSRGLQQVRMSALDANDRRAGYVVIVWPRDDQAGDDAGARVAIGRAVVAAERGLAATREALNEISEFAAGRTDVG